MRLKHILPFLSQLALFSLSTESVSEKRVQGDLVILPISLQCVEGWQLCRVFSQNSRPGVGDGEGRGEGETGDGTEEGGRSKNTSAIIQKLNHEIAKDGLKWSVKPFTFLHGLHVSNLYQSKCRN